MKAQDKPKYVQEARELYGSLDVDALIDDPNNLKTLEKISRLIAIFTNFSYNDGQDLKELLCEFQKWARRSTSIGTIRNRATDMLQFIIQKIEEMDIYVIEEPIRKKQEKIVKSLKDENLWMQSSLEGKDLHILVGERNAKAGEHVHLISDSETGEIRVDADDKTPDELIERVVSITTKHGSTIGISQYGVKTTMEFINKDTTEDKDPPILYATGIRRSGGPQGHFDYITIKNVGKNIALDIHWGIRAFAYEWRPSEEPFELEPNKEKEVVFPTSSERVFKEIIPELNVIMEYKDVNNKSYFTRRELNQLKVPSGAFYELKADTFHPPSILIDDGLRLISEPVRNGDRTEATFKINTEEGGKEVKIGLSGSLIAVFGFENDGLVKQAILELAHRLIRKMVKSKTLSDYCFTTHDLPEHHISGFEAYVQLRNNITY
jgi:hypothetical protein